MQVLGIVGPSGAGKTTLIEGLLPRLGDRGRVATVKSIHHDVEIDEPGKDTYRHRHAGAEATVGVTPSRTFGFVERGKRVEGRRKRAEERGKRTKERGKRVEDHGERVGERGKRLGEHGKRAEETTGMESVTGAKDEDEGVEAAILRPVLSGLADRGIDYVLVEGFSRSGLPKVAVGSPDDIDVVEPVVAHVDGGESNAPDEVLDAVDDLRSYETAASVEERERQNDRDGTVAVVSIESGGLATVDWIHERVEGPAGSIRDDLHARQDVVRATVDVRPPVVHGGIPVVHLAIVADDPGPAFDAASEASDRLATATATDAAVECLLRVG